MNEFKELGLSDITIAAVEKKGFKKPSPIQKLTIPLLIDGSKDVIAQAQTGTGKTACFGLPILERIQENKKVQAIVLAPTRELALQVANEIESLKGDRKIRVAAIYGGASITEQMDQLRKGANIVVGTPGRMIDLINRRKLIIDNIDFAVLDEADEMLNMGFVDDIEEILSKTNSDKRMLLFSATMPREILRIAQKFMRDYELVKDETKSLATDLIEQVYYDIMGKDRYTALKRLIAFTPNFHGLIFCKTRAEVDTVSNKLIKDEYAAAAIHGDISQGQRENTLKQFRDKNINILIATDVAARGIDVNDLNIVINYSLPQSPETYVHRIGRTGRAGNKGKAVTFLMPSEKNKLRFVEKILKSKIPKGELPGIDEIIAVKKEHIQSTIIELLQKSKKTEYDEISKKLLTISDPEHVVAAVLQYSFANQLDSKDYSEIQVVTGYEKSSRGGSRPRRGGNRRDGRGDSRGGSRGGSRDGRGGSRGGSRDGGRDRPPRRSGERSGGDRPPRRNSDSDGFKPRGEFKPRGDRPSYGDRPRGDRSSSDRPSRTSRPSGDRPSGRSGEFKPRSDRPSYGDRSSGARSSRPSGDRPPRRDGDFKSNDSSDRKPKKNSSRDGKKEYGQKSRKPRR